MIQSIPNNQLKLGQIPSDDADWQTIGKFALLFSGYEHHGSFTKCAEIANDRRDETLTDLRTCLFFEQRRWRHFGLVPDKKAMQYIRGIVEKIRRKIASENTKA